MRENDIAVIGGSGFVGKQILDYFFENGISYFAPTSREVDITNRKSVDEFVKSFKGKTIALVAGYANVDDAQTEFGKAMADRLNVLGTLNVAESAESEGKLLAYVSTNFVFSGTKKHPGPFFPYSETASISSPDIGEYARSKLMGERIVKNTLENYVIVRISNPFGNYDSEKDFIRKIVELMEGGYPLWLDQKITLTFLPDLAAKIVQINSENLSRILHVVRWPVTTPYEVGKFIFDNYVIKADEVKEGLLEMYVLGRTPRPLNGGLLPM